MKAKLVAPALGLLLTSLPAPPPPAWAEDEPPPIAVRRERQGDAVVVDALLPGALLAWAAPRTAGGGHRILLLVAGAERGLETNLLLALDPEGGPLVETARDLAPEISGLAALDLDGDGVDELLVGEPGRFHLFAPPGGGTPERGAPPMAAVAGLDPRSRPPGTAPGTDDRPNELHLARLGALDRFRPDGAGGVEHVVVADLPIRAERRPGGLLLRSPEATLLRRAGGAPLYAVGPEAMGRQRLRTTLHDPGGELGFETWSRLPAAEVVQWHRYVMLNDAPVLVLTVNSADKMGLFERQRLRVFDLRADRTRAGAGPLLEGRTASRRWQRVWPFVADADGDGIDDLVVVQTDGLGGMKLVVEAFRADGRGGLDPKPRRTAVDRPVELPLFGPDVTGDGAPDLLVVGGSGLVVLAGNPGSRRHVVEKGPARVVTFSDSAAGETEVELDERGVAVRDRGEAVADTLELIDLDGDGRRELVILDGRRGHRRWAGGRVRLVRWGDD